MNTMPRQLLTSGTAVAAVVGALLLGAEDAGRMSASDAAAIGIDAGRPLWQAAPRAPAGPGDARAVRDRQHALERR